MTSWLLLLDDVILLERRIGISVGGDDDARESRDGRRPVTVMTVDVTGDVIPEVDKGFGEIWKEMLSVG